MRRFGTAKLVQGTWLIEAEPHVLMRLKRVFGRYGGRIPKVVHLRDTLEVCRDLAWFCERFPLTIRPAAYLKRRAKEHRKRGDNIVKLFSGKFDPRAFELALPARDYQRVAAEALLRRGSLLLCDDLGVGKTLSAIAAMTEPKTRPALVVTLTHLPNQWQRELEKFAPELTAHIVKKGTPYAIGKKGTKSGGPGALPDVLIMNYHKLSGWRDALAGKMRSVFFDEVQELRCGLSTPVSYKYLAASAIAAEADFCMGMTGTPIYNYGGEFFSVLSVLEPDMLGTVGEFLCEWCGGGSSGAKSKITEPKAFGTYLREQGAMLRRTRVDVGRELPPLSVPVHHIEADTKALANVEKNAAELARLILTVGGAGFQKMQAAEQLSYLLRQATGIAKAPYVATFVRLLVESGERVVLYGWHRAVYAIWLAQLKDLNPVMYTGSESPAQKERSFQQFTKGESDVMIISLRAGAGLDGLQHNCRTVVFGELDWSPGVHEQNIGRVYRDLQTEPVVAYMLLSDSGSDPVIADVLGLKRAQIEGVRDPDAPLVEKLQLDPGHVRRLAEGYLQQLGDRP